MLISFGPEAMCKNLNEIDIVPQIPHPCWSINNLYIHLLDYLYTKIYQKNFLSTTSNPSLIPRSPQHSRLWKTRLHNLVLFFFASSCTRMVLLTRKMNGELLLGIEARLFLLWLKSNIFPFKLSCSSDRRVAQGSSLLWVGLEGSS